MISVATSAESGRWALGISGIGRESRGILDQLRPMMAQRRRRRYRRRFVRVGRKAISIQDEQRIYVPGFARTSKPIDGGRRTSALTLDMYGGDLLDARPLDLKASTFPPAWSMESSWGFGGTRSARSKMVHRHRRVKQRCWAQSAISGCGSGESIIDEEAGVVYVIGSPGGSAAEKISFSLISREERY